tara:strand:- start:666 stop:842 length:177 start_codon:yes stop_codon:yes gene_type:complete
MVSQIKYGRKGSNQENMVAIPLLPARIAISGVMQHKDAVIAVSILAKAELVDLPEDFI